MHPNIETPTNFKDFTADYISELAAKKSWKYTQQIHHTFNETGLYVNSATDTKKQHVLEFDIGQLACEYYSAEFIPVIIQNSKVAKFLPRPADQEMRYQVQVFSVTLPYSVEDVYVESRTNLTLSNLLGLSSVVFKNSRRVSLEGGFNEYFRVYVPEQEELNAFTILAPNIMMYLLEHGGNYDFEFSGRKVYFYQTFKYFTSDFIPISKTNYDNLLTFGINSAEIMSRAGRPTDVIDPGHNQPMWELFGTSTIAFITYTLLAMVAFLFIGFCIIFPPLWPLIAILALLLCLRYRKLVKAKADILSRFK